MKAIFCKFFSFFLQFSRRRQGEGKDAPHQGRRICQKIADFQHPGTDEPEIEHPAPKEKEDPVQPDLPPPCLLRPDEQRHCHNDPEGQIQHRPQQGQGHPDPEDTEQVIQQPHRQPQRRRLGQGGGLLRHRNGHVSAADGRRIRPAPGCRPHRIGNPPRPPPAGLPRPERASRCADPPLHCGHDDGVFIEALHLLHAGDGQLFPPLQNDMVCPLHPGHVLFIRHCVHPFPFFPFIWDRTWGYACLPASVDTTQPPRV